MLCVKSELDLIMSCFQRIDALGRKVYNWDHGDVRVGDLEVG